MKPASPTQQEIAARAWELWYSRGQPTGQDLEIWLEAERLLTTPSAASNAATDSRGDAKTKNQGSRTPTGAKPADVKPKSGPAAQTERLRGEMASESEVEFQITPAPTDDEAIKAALQKREARAPQVPHTTAPHAKPPETGKPVWPKPHSS